MQSIRSVLPGDGPSPVACGWLYEQYCSGGATAPVVADDNDDAAETLRLLMK
jgi:hypothetical protein